VYFKQLSKGKQGTPNRPVPGIRDPPSGHPPQILNTSIFPVSYEDKFYQQVLTTDAGYTHLGVASLLLSRSMILVDGNWVWGKTSSIAGLFFAPLSG